MCSCSICERSRSFSLITQRLNEEDKTFMNSIFNELNELEADADFDTLKLSLFKEQFPGSYLDYKSIKFK